MAQVDLAVAIGSRYNQQMISHVENGRSGLLVDGLVKAAEVLDVSLDYLVGLTDDPRSSAKLPSKGVAESMAQYDTEDDVPMIRPVEVVEVAASAGAGAQVFDETVVGVQWFRQDWLDGQGIDPAQAMVISVSGESMEPTLLDGCSILVDRSQIRKQIREDHLFVLRTDDGLVVKRAGRDAAGQWQLLSDHPNWPPAPWSDDIEVIGQVRWAARAL